MLDSSLPPSETNLSALFGSKRVSNSQLAINIGYGVKIGCDSSGWVITICTLDNQSDLLRYFKNPYRKILMLQHWRANHLSPVYIPNNGQ